MQTLPCSACGAALELRAGIPYGVCPYCHSLLLRRGLELEAIGHVSEVPDDFSPLQVGATGKFEQRNFAVVGRIRKRWAEGSWNEWCLVFDDQTSGWLAEAQGDWVMLFPQPANALAKPPTPEHAEQIMPGDAFHIGGEPFKASDIKYVGYAAAEGELASFVPGTKGVLSVDLRGPGLAFATLEFGPKGYEVFVGRYVAFDECNLTGLRELEGWS